jgi:hypothetical protein
MPSQSRAAPACVVMSSCAASVASTERLPTGRMHPRLANTCTSASVKTAAHVTQYICVLSYVTASCKATATAALPVLSSSLVRV